jgi:hypothetical protein
VKVTRAHDSFLKQTYLDFIFMLQILVSYVIFGVALIPEERAHWLLRRIFISLFPLLLHLFIFDSFRGRFGFCEKKTKIDEYN